ncbi:MAG: hypothetical protein H7X77_10960, partial [Anaerolineae bacterium]|nr:hypothetical protein [Anaerolineae bacterium]
YGFSVFGDFFAPSWDKVMYTNLDGLDATHENFSSMVVGGKSHTILASPEFYTYGVDGMTVRDWFTALLAGEKVENLRCTDCVEAEVVTP